ncbi:enoyl-CoA hydratase/isomerase family protein, partial [Pseudomonas juntendi]|uniref:enoyl-CoA hydratase/isomerase family protein n=1 Tax=Pseudomonas juntendi TaxID=2666183 RepID=UPI002100F66A
TAHHHRQDVRVPGQRSQVVAQATDHVQGKGIEAGDTLHETFFVEEYALDLAIHRYRKPVLVLMDGFTLGGGMGLA